MNPSHPFGAHCSNEPLSVFGSEAAMIVETLERRQKQDLKDIRKLSKTDFARAAQEARERLISAKIIGYDGKLAKPNR